MKCLTSARLVVLVVDGNEDVSDNKRMEKLPPRQDASGPVSTLKLSRVLNLLVVTFKLRSAKPARIDAV